MSGYVASARIVHATPRIARSERTIAPGVERSGATAAVVVETDGPAGPRGDHVAERWIAVRERFSQLTFFLFDPESWH